MPRNTPMHRLVGSIVALLLLSGSAAAQSPKAPSVDAYNEESIRVTIRFIAVDEDVMAPFYQEWDGATTRHATGLIEASESAPDLDLNQLGITASAVTRQFSHASSRVLSNKETHGFMQQILQAVGTNVVLAPKVSLFDQQQAEVKDVSTRPFVVDVDKIVHEETGRFAYQPILRSLDEGTAVDLKAGLGEGGKTRVACRVRFMGITDVREEQLLAHESEPPIVVQLPEHHVTEVTATEELAPGEALLIDPQVVNVRQARSDNPPGVNRIPYVGRLFKNTAVASVKQRMMVLIQAE